MKNIIIGICALLAVGCSNINGSTVSADESTLIPESVEKCDTLYLYPYMELYVPGDDLWDTGISDKGLSKDRFTFDSSTDVYAAPNEKGKKITALPPYTSIAIEREGIDPETSQKWYMIQYGRNGSNYGYIKDGNLDMGNAYGNFILGKSQLLDTLSEVPVPCFKLIHAARTQVWDNADMEKTISLELNMRGVDYYNHFYMNSLGRTALKENPQIARIYWHHGESCPESYGNLFIAYTKENKLIALPESSGTGEYGSEYYTKVYFPVPFDNGKVLLVENADIKNMYNSWDQTTNTIDYPSECGIPVEELIVAIEADEEGKYDEETGNYVEDENGYPIMEKLKHVVRFYRWNGTNIKLEKEIVHKDYRQEENI